MDEVDAYRSRATSDVAISNKVSLAEEKSDQEGTLANMEVNQTKGKRRLKGNDVLAPL